MSRKMGKQAMSANSDAQIAFSIAAYAREASVYDEKHTEIFTMQEQTRLREALGRAVGQIYSGGSAALDYGCGSGNLTRHLISLVDEVTAADLSPEFLDIVRERYDVATVHLEGGDAERIADDTYDLIALYSVLHHIPDYLDAVSILMRKLKPGGVLYLDHENNVDSWTGTTQLTAFHRELLDDRFPGWWAPHRNRWQYLLRGLLSPSRHRHRLRRWCNPRYSSEGDIHIWPDDHIEFDKLVEVIEGADGEIVERMNYLLYTAEYPVHIWSRYRDSCADMGGLIARRRA
jgi:ubiquinone/menaquinone biosynthesis C-methylase UbiE